MEESLNVLKSLMMFENFVELRYLLYKLRTFKKT